MTSSSVRLALQTGGRGYLEAHPPGDVTGARFEGRFVIYSMMDGAGQVFGEDVSLFAPECVARHGIGPQSAHLTAVRHGFALESFQTGDDQVAGHLFARISARTRFRVHFDAEPDGTRRFEDRASFFRGQEVAVYRAEEFFQLDPRSGTFHTRVNYSLLESTPFTFQGRTVDLGQLAPAMTEFATGQAPEEDPRPTPIPHDEDQFANRGPGDFAQRFAVGGAFLATD